MNELNSQIRTKASKAYKILRALTIVFAIFGLVAMLFSALIITLSEVGGWWFDIFAVYLAGIIMIVGTLYLSILTLLLEITRHICNKTKSDIYDTLFSKIIHRILAGTAFVGIITFIPFFLIFYDILNGGFAIFHFLCSGIIVALYLTLGIYMILRRSKTNSTK